MVSPAAPAATAIFAQTDQFVVAMREDAAVAVSERFPFNADGTVVPAAARVDVDVNDPNGVCVFKASAVGVRGKAT